MKRPLLSAEHQSFFRRHGFLLIPNVLTATELDILAQEVNLLLDQADQAGLDLVGNLGCVLEVLPNAEPTLETGQIRIVSMGTYSERRAQTCLREADRIYGELLPGYVRQLRGVDDTPKDDLCLVNEQYIVKPPAAGQASAFRWHTDGEYVHQEDFLAKMVSCWCVLDAVNEVNGTLEILSQETSTSTVIRADAGAVVFLSSTVLHRSFPNHSKKYRRVYMPQYSPLSPLPPTLPGQFPGSLVVTRIPGTE